MTLKKKELKPYPCFSPPACNKRCADAHDEHSEDDAERCYGVYLHPLVQQHFSTYEEQQDADAGFEIAEAVGYGCEQEEHSA